jgi:hypothetical protein
MAPFLLLIVWAADVAPCTLLDAKGTPLMDASGWLSLLTQDVLGMHVFYLSSQSGLTSSMPVFYRERLNSWTSASWKVATHFPVMRPSSGLDPNFRTPVTLLKPPSAIGRLAGEQEPMEKSVLYMHSPAMVVHSWSWFTLAPFRHSVLIGHSWVLVHPGPVERPTL